MINNPALERHLHCWAAWSLRHRHACLGYPSTSPYHPSRWVRTPKRQSQAPCIDDNPEAEQMERWLLQLHRHQPTWTRVIVIDYLEIGTQIKKARNAHVSISHYRRSLTNAKRWLQLQQNNSTG